MDEGALHQGISRRTFHKTAAAGAIGLTALGQIASGQDVPQEKSAADAKAAAPKIPPRELGKTGLKVSEISLGAMEVTDAAVVEKAIDDGCTYIDTAAAYQGGQNEVMVGTVMARRRKEVVLATKFSQGGLDETIASVNKSLKSLQTDVIDVIQVHNVRDAGPVKNPVYKEAFDRLKAEGKVRFFGYTTHANQVAVINACIETGYVDTMLVGFGATDPPEVGEALKRAREAGIGIVIMKSMKGVRKFRGVTSDLTPHQMAARWVLDQPYIDTLNIGMTSFAQVDENLKASSVKLSALDRLQLRRFAAAAACMTCSMCGQCQKCPQGVEPVEIMRAHMYAFSYGDVSKARREFLAMGGPAMLAACQDCGACEKNCPRGLKIRDRFREVAGLLA